MRGPCGGVSASPPQDPIAKRDNQAVCLGEWNKAVRRNKSTFRMTPANKRLCGTTLPSPEIEYGLIVKLELIARYRAAHILFEFPPVECVCLHHGEKAPIL